MNLFANAIDALEESNIGKTFTEIEENYNEIQVSTILVEDKKSVIIKISDNGSGIPEKIQQRIFDNLFTTKTVNKGTGLGLSIVKKCIDILDGEISVASEVGVGTKFTIKIPLNNSCSN